MSIVQQIGMVVYRNKATVATVVGCVGVVGGGILACKATLKVNTVLEENKTNVEAVKESGISDPTVYRKSLAMAYGKTGLQLVRLYGPAVFITGISLGSIFYGHNILRSRNLMIAGAYKALTMDYDSYRERVREFIGDADERMVRYNVRKTEIEDEDGNKREVDFVPIGTGDHYEDEFGNVRSKFFCESSQYWSEDPEENMAFLLRVQKDMQERLDEKGYLLLNTVYKELDIPESYAGSVCGWIKGYGSNVVDFGLFQTNHEAVRRFVNGLEPVILLNFNDDGYILDKI